MLCFTLLDKSYKNEEKREKFMIDSYFVLGVVFPPRNDVTSGKSCDLGHNLRF